jgi:hypothetical protein
VPKYRINVGGELQKANEFSCKETASDCGENSSLEIEALRSKL